MKYNESEKEFSKSADQGRKFVLFFGLISFFAAIAAALKIPLSQKKDVIACIPEDKRKKIKMLTQDGSLVEIDDHLIPANRRKITDTELQNWINHKNSKNHGAGN
ncbi:MAG TPA: hypothetical protein VMI12_09735 [Puia sp.]|nr:hypothetical protein [Puia sp.]